MCNHCNKKTINIGIKIGNFIEKNKVLSAVFIVAFFPTLFYFLIKWI